MKVTVMIAIFLVYLGSAYQTNCETKTWRTRIYATFYVDNWFEFYYNGVKVYQDKTTFIPHNGARFAFDICGRNHYFAINALDAGDDDTGLEYFNRCIGDGGARFKFEEDGWESGNVILVSNSTWNCKSYHYGPANWKDCYTKHRVIGQAQYGVESSGEDNMWLKNCRNKPTLQWTYDEGLGTCTAPDYDSVTDSDFATKYIDLSVDGSENDCTPDRPACSVLKEELPLDWYSPKEKVIHRDSAYEHSDEDVGWGISPVGCSRVDQGGSRKDLYDDLDHYFCNPHMEYDEISGNSGLICPNYGTGKSGSPGYGNGNFDSPSGKIDGTENGNGPYLAVNPEWVPADHYTPFSTYYNDYTDGTGTDPVDGVSSHHDSFMCSQIQVDSTLNGNFGTFDDSEEPIGGSNDCICPGAVDWGTAKFIWTRSLLLDNRITCALRFKTSKGYHNKDNDDETLTIFKLNRD